jgi:hypothetical protein
MTTFIGGQDGMVLEEPDDLGPYCTVCGCELERELCGLCDGTGYRDDEELMEEDPLWYQPGDTEPCGECGGKGGWWHCPNVASHPEGP